MSYIRFGASDIGEKCAICLTDLVLGDVTKLQCNHLFHTDCLSTMIDADSIRCPTCRTGIALPKFAAQVAAVQARKGWSADQYIEEDDDVIPDSPRHANAPLNADEQPRDASYRRWIELVMHQCEDERLDDRAFKETLAMRSRERSADFYRADLWDLLRLLMARPPTRLRLVRHIMTQLNPANFMMAGEAEQLMRSALHPAQDANLSRAVEEWYWENNVDVIINGDDIQVHRS